MPQPKDRRSRLQPEVRRTQIIEAATAILRDRALDEVTFEDIAEAAGVSRALVYTYFGDRGGLLAAVYQHTFGQLDALLAERIAASTSGQQRIHETVVCYLGFAAEHPEGWRLLHLAADATHPAIAAARRAHVEGLSRAWGTPDDHVVGCAVIGLLEAVAVDWLQQHEPDLDRLADMVSDLLWRGLSGVVGLSA